MNKVLLALAVLALTACQPIEQPSEPYTPPVETESQVGSVGYSGKGVGIKLADNVCFNMDGSIGLCI